MKVNASKPSAATAPLSAFDEEMGRFLRSPYCYDSNAMGGLLTRLKNGDASSRANRMIDNGVWFNEAGLRIACEGETYLLNYGHEQTDAVSFIHIHEYPAIHGMISDWVAGHAMTLEQYHTEKSNSEKRRSRFEENYLSDFLSQYEESVFYSDFLSIVRMDVSYFDDLTVDGEWFHNLKTGLSFKVTRFMDHYLGLDFYNGSDYITTLPLHSFERRMSLTTHVEFIKWRQEDTVPENGEVEPAEEEFKPGGFRLGHGEWSFICFAFLMAGIFLGKLC